VSRDATAGPHWFDSLARWAARGEAAAASVSDVSSSGRGQGISRRTVLRTAAAAALLTGPLRLLIPTTAHAGPLGACFDDSHKRTADAFQACVKDPLQAFEAAKSSIATDTDNLTRQKKPAARKRLLKNIDTDTRAQGRALKQIENCNAKYWDDGLAGEDACYAANPPSGGGGTGGGGGGVAGCGPGNYVPCGDQPCCDLSNATCVSGTSGDVCCVIGGAC